MKGTLHIRDVHEYPGVSYQIHGDITPCAGYFVAETDNGERWFIPFANVLYVISAPATAPEPAQNRKETLAEYQRRLMASAEIIAGGAGTRDAR